MMYTLWLEIEIEGKYHPLRTFTIEPADEMGLKVL